MESGTCMSCQTPLEAGAGYCAVCGRAVRVDCPTPRIVPTQGFAATSAGRAVQVQGLLQHLRNGRATLLVLAIIDALLGLLILQARSVLRDGSESSLVDALMVMLFVVAGLLLLLYFWSLRSPLPALIVGLVLYLSGAIANVVSQPQAYVRGMIIAAAVLYFLIHGVVAGVRLRQMKQRFADV